MRALRRRIGGNIHSVRARRAMPLHKLSRLSGLPIHKIDQWEIGAGDIDLHAILRLAAALRVSADQLLTQGGNA